ncbi:MAG: polyprenyl diphosphate synthase [Rhodospirillales bacterium]
MDGNGRWARSRGLPRTAGHRQGADAARAVVRAAGEAGVRHLTLFSFSSENWRRPADEISDLMGLLRIYLRAEVKTLHENGVRLRVIGERALLPEDIRTLIEQAEHDTAANTGLTLVLALSYGGRADLTNAARELARRVKEGALAPQDINEDTFSGALSTAGIPDPDLLIRTSGEQRVSNFLLWEMAYTEYLFVDTLWPDFGAEAFHQALDAYAGRERRYGAS